MRTKHITLHTGCGDFDFLAFLGLGLSSMIYNMITYPAVVAAAVEVGQVPAVAGEGPEVDYTGPRSD